MIKPPWLSEFVFLDTHWESVSSISENNPNFKSYDLAADWVEFTSEFVVNNPTLDYFKMLRNFRQTRLAYLAYQDLLLPVESHPYTMKLVSDLADLLIRNAYEVVEKEMVMRHGKVIGIQNKTIPLLVFALGKLGTCELNYSSDVDLVFLYSNDGLSNGPRPLEASAYFIRFGQKIIKLLDHYTSDGLVYRVDMRLRPFGSAGPLACSVAAFHQYLLLEGREWERFAWMRARMICGSDQDHSSVMSGVTPFIYRRHLDYNVFTALAKIKNEIAENLSFGPNDLKHGAGGIRAIEFIVQSLQLVFGGRNELLQGTSIKAQINQLGDHGKLQNDDCDLLLSAWLLLRKLENISQAVADNNTHEQTDNDVIQQMIATVFAFNDWSEMSDSINQYRDQVSQLFNQLFEHSEETMELDIEQRSLINQMMVEMSTYKMPIARHEQVERLIKKSVSLVNESVLRDFVALLKKITSRPSYLMMLQKESNVHLALLDLMSKHQYFSQTLEQYPVLLEQLFEHESFQLFDQISLTDGWLNSAPQEDTEAWMESIRYFKLVNQFNVIIAWSNGAINSEKSRQQLTQLAQFILIQVVKHSWHEIRSKLPDITLKFQDLIVIAYGSAAVDEMTISSDLDLVFVLDVNTLNDDERLFSQKWVKKIMHHLGSHMYHGKLYELDMQLRPNGNSGSLITTKPEYEKYQLNEAWVWEHAAMIKSHAVVATCDQNKWHQNLRSKILQLKRDPEVVDHALSDMALKLQQLNPDNSHDGEFKLLSAILKYSHQFPSLTDSRELDRVYQQLLHLDLINSDNNSTTMVKKDPAS